MFYLRPRFYKFLPPDDRPPEWEKYAEEDEMKWQQEQNDKTNGKAKTSEKRSSISSVASTASDLNDSMSHLSPSVVEDDDDDGDETEDEKEPVVKKLRMD